MSFPGKLLKLSFGSSLLMASMEGLEPITVSPQKHDPCWKHCQVFVKNDESPDGVVNKVELKKCLYCGKMFQGGGIHRLKEHLAGRKGNGPICDRAPEDVRIAMQQNLENKLALKRQKMKQALVVVNSGELDSYSLSNHGQCTLPRVPDSALTVNRGDVGISSDSPACVLRENSNAFSGHAQQRLPPVSFPHSGVLENREEEVGIIGNASSVKRKRLVDEDSYAGDHAGTVSNDLELERVNSRQRIQVAIGRFLYEIGASLDAVKESVYFQPMIDALVSGGSGITAPSYHDLRGWVLKDVVKEVRNDISRHTTLWEKTGCSLLASQWNSGKGRSMLNFSVYSPEGTVFLRSVDLSDIIHSPDALHNLFKQVVEELGVQHVLQVITKSEEHYIVVGKRLMETFPTLYWSPCAADCIESMLEDFGKIEWIKSAIEQARSVTRFIYKHTAILNIMRRYTFGIDIVRPGECLFATNFMTLKQMADLKLNLQSMVTSQEWMGSSYSNTTEGLMLLDTLTNRSFWSSIILITRLTDPLMRVLSLVGSQKRAAMGYVFAGIYRAKEMIKRELPKREDYMFYWNIIDRRWKKLWHSPLHTAGFFLNPKFFYSVEGNMANSIMSGVFDCIERLVSDVEVQDRIVKEMNLYKDAAGDLGRKLATRARDTLLPGECF